MNKHFFISVCCLIAALSFTSCEKPVVDDVYTGKEQNANVILHFKTYTQEPFTRATATLTDQCSRLSVAIFKDDGTKVKTINQTTADDSFGTVAVSLAGGNYTVVAIAHNSTEGSATISSPEKVTFASNKMTDTFSCCATVAALDGSPVEETLHLQRVVAMVRLNVTGTIPDEVARFKFYYTGGSSTLNPSTGYGCVNSKQTEYRATVVDGSPVSVYELYTSPHELNDVLKLTITAQDADNSTVNEWTMENIPVTKNKITTWTGSLFSNDGGGPSTDGSITITLDTTWGGTVSYTW